MKIGLVKTLVCPTCASGFKIKIKKKRKNEALNKTTSIWYRKGTRRDEETNGMGYGKITRRYRKITEI